MRDGNKESAKELMATFRLVVAASVSLFVLFASLHIRGVLRPTNVDLFNAGLGSAALSSILCSWLFLMVVGMLHREQDDIVYQVPVLVIGGLALLSFLGSIALVFLGQS